MSACFPKKERLHLQTDIDLLFKQPFVVCYPIRISYILTGGNETALLVSVPKRKITLATNRNTIKRRIREAYRNHKLNNGKHYHIAIVYTSSKLETYQTIETALITLLNKVN